MPTRRRHPKFIADVLDAYAYLVTRNPSAADRFLNDVEATAELVREFPEMGRDRGGLSAGLRSFRLRRFRYVLFYRVTDNGILLYRLLHGARDQSEAKD